VGLRVWLRARETRAGESRSAAKPASKSASSLNGWLANPAASLDGPRGCWLPLLAAKAARLFRAAG